jgi:hypothetical protein
MFLELTKAGAIAAMLLVGVAAADAWVVRKWQCGEIEVTLDKRATKEPLDLTFNGYLPKLKRLDFRFVGDEGAKLNGKHCRLLPDDEDNPTGGSPRARPAR